MPTKAAFVFEVDVFVDQNTILPFPAICPLIPTHPRIVAVV